MLTTTVYDEVTGEYYTRKATEFDGVGDPGEEDEWEVAIRNHNLYCNIINMIDDIVLKNRNATKKEINQLNDWMRESIATGKWSHDETQFIMDIADANDCYAETWEEMIDGFKKLWANGERVHIG